MNQMNFNHLKINYNKKMHVFMNNETKKVIFISKDLEEIHAVLEINNNQEFKVHPRWNVNFFVTENEITVDLNYAGEDN
ncbi:hypothetical protein SAMN05421736_1415 [Evansella caseinilytica]|uniref:Uncharacterized protein n=1 Tax=Evansella caseinilytica TaxID=1503961 RepID=A0A1H3V2E3_9BACI|nr:hypothetical protein [Evansella caseinilytica]SDZ68854.1 hypothetical protein SAMN05421736_1415 [Evansella caseinilytica]